MTKIFRAGIVTLATVILTACGGGGSESTSSSEKPASYWTMDANQYINGGNSAVSISTAATPVTTAAISTATVSGGDKSNGAYSGSALTFAFKGTSPTGVYTVVPDRTTFVAADASTAPILVDVMVGLATTTGSSTQYTASSGQVHVTRDASGAYHFSTVAAMPAAKTMDVLGGVAGAPAAMTLTIVDAY